MLQHAFLTNEQVALATLQHCRDSATRSLSSSPDTLLATCRHTWPVLASPTIRPELAVISASTIILVFKCLSDISQADLPTQANHFQLLVGLPATSKETNSVLVMAVADLAPLSRAGRIACCRVLLSSMPQLCFEHSLCTSHILPGGLLAMSYTVLTPM